MHRATVLLRVSTVVAFCAALIGSGAVGAKAEINTSVPAGVYLFPNPRQRFALRIYTYGKFNGSQMLIPIILRGINIMPGVVCCVLSS